MNPWIAKAILLASNVAMIAIRAPHGQRSRAVAIAQDRRGPLETALLAFAMLGFLLPFAWMATSWLSFADYPSHLMPLLLGTTCLAAGLWLFHRSHADLGTNWSITLQVRANHSLVTRGVYAHVRHPMYSALFLYSIGQALALPNWLAGASYLVPFTLLFALRVGAEERMMLDEFGAEYSAYAARTKRIIPGVW